MSSPKITRMFGFFAKDGVGDCAVALPGAIRTQACARLSAVRMSFVFMELIYFVLVLRSRAQAGTQIEDRGSSTSDEDAPISRVAPKELSRRFPIFLSGLVYAARHS